MVSIVLVEPENPDNIGAVARAMKNMGLSDLRLVRPVKGWRVKGKKLAMSAGDLLAKARAFTSLEKAVSDSAWVLGTTRRLGSKRGQVISFENAVAEIFQKSRMVSVAVLFGKESKGLDNESLKRCDSVLNIPSHPDYPSLNLAQAVMVVAFSLFQQSAIVPAAKKTVKTCNQSEVQDALTHFEKALRALNYEKPGDDLLERILTVFHGIFKRAGMMPPEAQMIKGLSRRIVQKVKR